MLRAAPVAQDYSSASACRTASGGAFVASHVAQLSCRGSSGRWTDNLQPTGLLLSALLSVCALPARHLLWRIGGRKRERRRLRLVFAVSGGDRIKHISRSARAKAKAAVEEVQGLSAGSSILSLFSPEDDEEEKQLEKTDASSAWGGVFEEVLAEQTEAARQRHQKALDRGSLAGHSPVLLFPAMKWMFLDSFKATSRGLPQPDDHDNMDIQEDLPSDKRKKPVPWPSPSISEQLYPREAGEELQSMELFDGLYIDCTFGRGGFSREILTKLSDDARLIAFDMDPAAIFPGRSLEDQDPRFKLFHSPFGELVEVLKSSQAAGFIAEAGPPVGIVMDIGVSSPQMDDRSRGFSLQNMDTGMDFPMDLRMNPSAGKSASVWLESVSVEELAWVLNEYGDDFADPLQSERIAQLILDDQELRGPFRSMRRFAELVGRALCAPDEEFEHAHVGSEHRARLTVQAIRLFMNSELEQLRRGLEAAFCVLAPGGRCVISVFKRKEAYYIDRFIMDHENPDAETVARLPSKRRLAELYPLAGTDLDYSVRLIGKPVRPSQHEVNNNRRSRSGILYVLEKAPRTVPRVKAKPRAAKNRFVEPPRNPLLEPRQE
ncbi:unnamed protein product [Polarella glacialis]|uniref:Uncharacterized protein n=2 Tax=Polarella glacialis TaxID=89957 RepID=A0A813LFV2_POLGL|nr:unnamed protein product [Polarella glacialis]CAE8726525.1 unnamed protein product [Polarella glacialis]